VSASRIENASANDRLAIGLRLVVMIQSIGSGGRYLFSANETESDIDGCLFFDCGFPEPLAQQIENGGMLLTVFCGGVLGMIGCASLANRSDWVRWCRRVEPIAAIWIAIWMLAIAVTQMIRTSTYPQWMLA